MRRRLRDLVANRSNIKPAEATAIEHADNPTETPPDDTAWGLDVLVEGVDPVVDIVAIHGLNGHREKTWTAKNSVNWLRDLNMLPAYIPNARIMSWGYDASTHSTKELSAMYLYDHAQKLVADLSLHRRLDKTDNRPLIFVAHSLGGIVLKSALIHSDSTRSNNLYHHRSIKTSTYGIIFMGTPHQGGEGVMWGKRLVGIASIFVKTNDRLLNILERDSEALQQQLGQYNSISSDFETKFAFETKATALALGSSMIIVPKASAVVPGQVDAESIAIMDDHVNMVKFLSPSNEFKTIAGHLKLMVEKAPAKVQENWLTETGVEAARRRYLNQNFDVPFDLTGVPKTSVFIGRKSDLNLMEEQLMPDGVLDRQKVCVVYGLGGIGKTQLAIEYARVHKPAYTSCFWLDGKTELSLIQSLLKIVPRLPKGQILDRDIQDVKGLGELRKRAQEILKWFASKGNYQWLLIFDNIDKTSFEDDDIADASRSASYNITEYFPPCDAGSIIITTRLQRLVSLGNYVHLGKLDVLDSLMILEKHARRSLKQSSVLGESELAQWDLDAISLVERLGHLPLALVFAGSYISKTTIVKYLELYDNSWTVLHGQMKNRTDYPERTIITTWQISFEELVARDKGAANLLRLWGFLDNQELWFQLLRWQGFQKAAPDWLQQITASEISFLATINTLLDYSLIEQNDNSETYSVHTVVHDWIRASLGGRKDEELLYTAMISVGLTAPRQDAKGSAALERRLLPHVLRVSEFSDQIDSIEQRLDHAFLVSHQNLGDLCKHQGKLVEAEKIYQKAIRGREKAFGPEHPSTLDTTNNLGLLYEKQGKLVEAEEMLQRALRGREKALGPDHPSTLESVNNLGLVYADQGKPAETEEMYQRALRGLEKALGSEHVSTLSTINNLGLLYIGQGKLVEAEEMLQRALKGKEKAFGSEHILTLGTISNLGNLFMNQGKLVEAEEVYQRALRGYEKALGPEHPSTLTTLRNLGIIYEEQEKFAEAETIYQRVLRGQEKALGSEHISTLDVINGLGVLYTKQEKLVEAEEMLQRALRGREKAFGPEHPSTLEAVNNLGLVYADQGKPAETEEMYQRALKGFEKALGPEHISTLHTINNLGILYTGQGKVIEAEEMLQRAQRGYKNALGPEHRATIDTINNLGNLYARQEKLAESKAMFQQALRGYRKVLGPEHTLTLTMINNLGIIYAEEEKLVEAEEMLQQALQGRERVFGPEHISTIDTINSLGLLYEMQGRPVEAEEMLQRALRGKEKTLGPHHMSTLETIDKLRSLHVGQGRQVAAGEICQRASNDTGMVVRAKDAQYR